MTWNVIQQRPHKTKTYVTVFLESAVTWQQANFVNLPLPRSPEVATGSSPEPLRNRAQSRLHLLKPKVASGPPFLIEDLRILKGICLIESEEQTLRMRWKKPLTSFPLRSFFIFSQRVQISSTFHVFTATSRLPAALVQRLAAAWGARSSLAIEGLEALHPPPIVWALHPYNRILEVRKLRAKTSFTTNCVDWALCSSAVYKS